MNLKKMDFKKDGKYSPNYILVTVIVAAFCIILLCGKSLWVPVSGIKNLHIRSVLFSLTDALSAFSSSVGIDGFVPELRESFIQSTGLADHPSWDSRYYNNRDVLSAGEPGVLSVPPVETVPDPAEEAVPVISAEIPPAAPVRPTRPPAGEAVFSSENPLRIYIFGDSQVFSLGSGFSRLVGRKAPIDVDFLAIHSSGFVRGDYYNWNTKIRDIFNQESYDLAVIMLGMNDYQNFWNNQGIIMKKRTPEWEAAYKQKCRNIIDTALSYVSRVYWLGMPAAKNREYNESLLYIDSVQEALAAEYSPDVLIRISLRDTIPGQDQPYMDAIALENGKSIRVMGDDGSHYTVEGGQLVMKPFFDRLITDYRFSEIPVAYLPE
ncbi:DUF459 domain-containing protein [Brucepastera parasyntrophica]|uniref:DUF459 domain-containing protein n=1 Tax=Brucepastera parasyntrophica TaxID=2880008 RepID=UPI00210A586F|nr:DUF459 domain-containing protein [Brucepastera parasyntrophica]ULQ59664.1 DUF459 domain-containing protein [Brucepastera parasyntrophica]